MDALGPQSPVWQGIPEAETVTICPTPADLFPFSNTSTASYVLIPVMEKHIVSRPCGFWELSPTSRAVDTLGDKKKFADYAQQHGLSGYIPETYNRLEDVRFPCVIKRTNLNAGTGIERVTSQAHLTTLLSEQPWAGQPFVLQDYMANSMEYCSHLVCKSGDIIWDCSFAYSMNDALPIRGSGLNRAAPAPQVFTPPHHILSQIRAFLKPLEFTGPCNVDYKIGADGNIRVLEINPRFGGTLMAGSNRHHLEGLLRCIIANASLTLAAQAAS